MSKVLLGSTPKYYEYRGAEPYLNFDRTSFNRVVFPTKSTVESFFSCNVVSPYDSANVWNVLFGSMGAYTSGIGWFVYRLQNNIRIERAGGGGVQVNVGTGTFTGNITVSVTGTTATMTLEGYAPVQLPSVVMSGTCRNTIGCRVSNTDINVFTDYATAQVHSATINGYSYINQGDQNPNNILPSTPAGANGTISGAGWRYVGIDGHYETVTAFNSWLNTTTLTEPLEVILLEPLDTSTIPESKAVSPIAIQLAYTIFKTFDFSFGFHF